MGDLFSCFCAVMQNSSFLLAFLVCLIFVSSSLAASGDTSANCYPTLDNSVLNSCASNATDLEENDWTTQTVAAGSSLCLTFNSTTTDDSDVFVLAVRPGSDAAGAFSQVQANAFANNTAFGCAAVQPSQTKNQMDFSCYPLSDLSTGVSITLTNRNTTSSATLDVYAGFSEGTVSGCSAGYVDEGTGALFWVGIAIIVILLLCVIAGAVGGFVYWKKNKQKSDYETFESA